MVEVFVTNVTDPALAESLASRIAEHCTGHSASFDLEDRDRVLRVDHPHGNVSVQVVMRIVLDQGYSISVMTDTAGGSC